MLLTSRMLHSREKIYIQRFHRSSRFFSYGVGETFRLRGRLTGCKRFAEDCCKSGSSRRPRNPQPPKRRLPRNDTETCKGETVKKLLVRLLLVLVGVAGLTIPAKAQALVVVKRSEEHTSELQSRLHLVCRLLLEKKNKTDCR